MNYADTVGRLTAEESRDLLKELVNQMQLEGVIHALYNATTADQREEICGWLSDENADLSALGVD